MMGAAKIRTVTSRYPGHRGAQRLAREGATDDLNFLHAVRDVTIDYQLLPNTDGSRQLQLNTHREDGNYELSVGLTFDFTGSYVNGSAPGQQEIATTAVSVQGQVLSGNDALAKHKQCLFVTWYELTHQYQRALQEFGPPPPPEPPDWERIEAGLEAMSQALRDLLLPEPGAKGGVSMGEGGT
jgi:hypothetical protein